MRVIQWVKSAFHDLAALWIHADPAERAAITRAVHRLEQRLRRNAENEGEWRAEGRRILFQAPLAVQSKIIEDVVRILEVFRYGRAEDQ